MDRSRRVFCAVALGLVALCVSVGTGTARECPEFAGLIPGNVSVVEVSGDYAYLGNGPELTIADVTNPAIPTAIAGLHMPAAVDSWNNWAEAIVAVATADGYAIVASSNVDHASGSLYLVDVRTPSHPVIVRSLQVDGPFHDLAINGGYAYIVAGGGLYGGTPIPGSMRVFDVRQPPNLLQVAFVEATWWAPQRIAVANGHAYIADDDSGLRVFDVSVPSAPVQVGSHGTPRRARAITVSDDYIYVVDAAATSGELYVIDVSTPSTPVEVGVLETSGDVLAVEVSGGYAYLPEGESGVRVVDVRVPSAPAQAGFIDTPGDGLGVAVANDRAYIADGREGMRVVNVSEPSTPVSVGFLDAIIAGAVAAADSFAFVASTDGLKVIDMSSPTAPVEVGFVNTTGFDVEVSGGYAYVAAGEAGLRVIDVSTPSLPMEVGFVDTPDLAFDVEVSGGYAYIVDLIAGLRVIDVSTPSAPMEVGFVDTTPELEFDVEVLGGYAYVAAGELGLRVIDVSTPSAPMEVGYIDRESFGVEISGGFAYVPYSGCPFGFPSECHWGFDVIDVSDPAAPVRVGGLDWSWEPPPRPSFAPSLSVSGDIVFLGDAGALHIVDVSTPSAPVEVRFLTTPGEPLDFAKSGNFTYAALDGAGMYMLDVRGCRRPYELPSTAEVE